MSVQASAADIGLLSTCAFLGNIGASLTGFGQAIIFLFIWQIVELAGYTGDFKSAVFIQALSLFSMQPLVLYKARVWKNAYRRVLILFVPITLISTPLGQLVSDGVPNSIVQAVAGVLVTFVACWELYSKRKWFLSFCSQKKSKDDEKEDGRQTDGADDAVDHHAAERGEAGVAEEEDVGEESNGTKEEEISTNDGEVGGEAETTDVFEENVGNNEEPSPKELAAEAKTTAISSVYASLAVEPNSNVGISTTAESARSSPPQSNQEDEEQLKFGINKPTLMTLLAGGEFCYSIENSLSNNLLCVDTHD